MAGGKGTKRQRKKELRRARIEQQIKHQRARRRRPLLLGLGLLALAVTAFLVQSAGSEDRSKNRPQAGACTHDQPGRGNTNSPNAPPAMAIDPSKTYTAVVDTSCGSVEIELAAATSPNTVNSFVFLAEQGFYDGLKFHRVVKDFAIQGGDPKGDGSGGVNYKTVDAPPADFRYVKGTVAMAKTQTEPAGTAGSQFFIVPAAGAEASLTPDYAVLGKVVKGQDVVSRLNSIATQADPNLPGGETSVPVEPIFIKKITIKKP